MEHCVLQFIIDDNLNKDITSLNTNKWTKPSSTTGDRYTPIYYAGGGVFGTCNIDTDGSKFSDELQYWIPTDDAVKAWVNSNYLRKNATCPSGTGWRNSGAKLTITVAGRYLVIGFAEFAATNMMEGVRLTINNTSYSQNVVNMTYSQSIQIATHRCVDLSVNSTVQLDVYTAAAQTPYSDIVAIRIA